MVYLIGVNHQVQFTNRSSNLSLINNFTSLLEKTALDKDIFLIAEEFSMDALKLWQASACTARDVSKKLKIKHLFCDPSKKEQKKLGYPTQEERAKEAGSNLALDIQEVEKKYFPIRENYWFKKIEPYINENILFVCGQSHIESFSVLLKKNKIDCEILSQNWGNKPEDFDHHFRS